ncbi:hypothetical protein TanjilG_28296 [Lupinus angustifolius]|uniref:Uncharacterized protein n=1 Tax=Lupinus angustifolius TaxID=3871 RepID=A0A4P1RIY0_LUPAN|nr:PREDICTED: uncharacterized protein LOC109347118 [Lupinus angustifolius]OIW11205.1 hypothetical protein TanjilG_28296 [Lupinus angustifolius]
MKLSTKPISSPGRSDKFPPPLMRFLRSNVGSRSRGRSRSNSRTMFVRKKNTIIETSQEPTSPKVTCMGQVRVKRSSKSKQQNRTTRAAARDGAPTRCRCFWIRKSAFQIKLCHCQPVWPKWGFSFKVGSFRRKSTKMKEDSIKTELEAEHVEEEEDEQEHEERVMSGDDASSLASKSCTPPSNALLLTRCRSEPYRSSSLASRFWGSPLKSEEETEEKQGNEIENRGSSYSENEIPHLERNSVSDEEGKRVSENEEKVEFFKELEDSFRDRISSMNSSENVDELKKRENGEGDCEEPRPIVLTRCKSEPARTGFKLEHEVNNLSKKRKLDLDDTSD